MPPRRRRHAPPRARGTPLPSRSNARQVFSGTTGQPGDTRRKVHRIVGTYILMPVLLPSMGIAVALQYTNGPADNDFLINLLNALFVVGCFGAGIWAAKRKRYAEHKDWVLLGLVISMQNGLSRVGMYLMQPLFNCDPFLSDWPIFFSLAVGIALVSYYFWKAGRLLVRSNIAILTIMLAICIMMLVQGVGFECPPERAFNGTVWRNFEANTPARYAPQPGPLA